MRTLIESWFHHIKGSRDIKEEVVVSDALEYAMRMAFFFGCEVMQQRMLEIYAGHKPAAEVERLIKETQDEISREFRNSATELKSPGAWSRWGRH